MNVLHINTLDESGGAARAARRLHMGLRRLGHRSSIFVRGRTSNDSTVTAFAPPIDLRSCLRWCLGYDCINRDFTRDGKLLSNLYARHL